MERKLCNRFFPTFSENQQDFIQNALSIDISDEKIIESQFLDSNPLILAHKKEYELFFESVMKGELGPTAQFGSIYIYMINRVHRDLMRVVRTNDVDAYISTLPAIIDIFLD